MKHTLQSQRGETIVEVLVSFLLLMIFTSMFVVSLRYANDQIVPLCTQKAIVQLPGEPVILYEPGTWDGKASSES